MAERLRSEQFMQQALDSWGGAVYRLALSHTRCAADAQDIAQDAFLSLLKSTVLFNDDEHVKAWLLHVTANPIEAPGSAKSIPPTIWSLWRIGRLAISHSTS